MIFSSIQYLLFLPLVAILYWRTRGRARLIVTVVASYFFYMSWLPVYGILLFALTGFNWLLGIGLEHANAGSPSWRKPLLTLGLIGNLGCLCFYKYTNFFITNLLSGMNFLGGFMHATPLTWTMMNLMLPLGISFFIFEFVHYIVDVYRGTKCIRSWLEFAAFSAFFPSQIAGPIKRFQDFIGYLRAPLPWSLELLNEAGTLIVQGLFKKVAIADPINGLVSASFTATAVLSAPDAWLASLGFFIQVYCDFSGYTDIGRGSALLLGIRLPENFNLPYLAKDLSDFWRRWHMSLGLWLRDYVFFSLGGSRCSQSKAARNLFLTMVACGLWHGAAWHYVIFGAVHGATMALQAQWRNFLQADKLRLALSQTPVALWLAIAGNALFIVVTFTLFRAPDLATFAHFVSAWFNSDTTCSLLTPILRSGVLWFLGLYFAFWLLTEALKRLRGLSAAVPVNVYPMALRFASWTAAIILMVAARPSTATPFVYFQF